MYDANRKIALLNLLCGVGSLGVMWAACWQHGIQYAELRMNKYYVMDLQEVGGGGGGFVGTGWSWLRIGTGGGHLWVR
jgi:hypothetical protein